MGAEAQTGHTDRNLTVSPAISGNNPLDKMKNVYDLEGNYYEWTAEADDTYLRMSRGGGYDVVRNGNFYPASDRSGNSPADAYIFYCARAGLYVNL